MAVDVFTIVGVPAGATATFQARLSVGASACSGPVGSGSGEAGLRESDSNFATVRSGYVPPAECSQVSETAQITLTLVTGESFALTYYATAYGGEGGNGAAYGTLTFAGLPPGAIIRSCHGFEQEFPVPAIPLSWGSLKQRYH